MLLKLYCKFIYWFSSIYKPEGKKSEVLGILDSLNPLLFKKHYNSNKASQYPITVVSNGITSYHAALDNAYNYIKRKEPIPNHWCTYNYNDITVDKFLLDSSGRYLNIPDAIAKFSQKLKRLNDALIEIENSQEAPNPYNKRIIGKYFEHCLNVSRSLINLFLNF